MARLNKTQKRFVIQQLAMFATLTEARDALKERFGVEVSIQAIEHYDPSKLSSEGLSQELKQLYEDTRKKYREDSESVPIANKVVRLQRLENVYQVAQRRGNHVTVLDTLERAAKESGGSYTNQRQLMGKDGGPIETRDVTALSREEQVAELRALLTPPGGEPPAIFDRPQPPAPTKEATTP